MNVRALMGAPLLLLALLAFEPTLIYGCGRTSRNCIYQQHQQRFQRPRGLLAPAKRSIAGADDEGSFPGHLVMSFGSGDEVVRTARAVAADKEGASLGDVASGGGGGGSGGGGKRGRNNRKSNKAQTHDANGSGNGNGNGGRKQQQHGGSGHNKGNKQRQFLKSQQHQNHQQQQQQHQGKRNKNHNKSRSENGQKNAAEKTIATTTVDGGKSQSTCRYTKNAWSECDGTTNKRSRTLTLKKGGSNCQATRVIQKTCKLRNPCRYEKGAWSECNNGSMTREDTLIKPVESASCEPTRSIKKKCGKQQSANGGGNKERHNRDKASRRPTQQS